MSISPPDTRLSLILQLRDPSDVQAWEEFARLYSQIVFRVARRRGLQTADAENVVQEVLLAVSRSVSQWLERRDRGRFHAWLLRIAKNEAADILSRHATRPLGAGPEATQALHAIPARSDLSSQLDLEYERSVFQWAADRVRRTVAAHTWQAFQLTHLEGYSIQEAAAQLQTRPGNIHFGRSRVMARIKQLVRQYEEDEA